MTAAWPIALFAAAAAYPVLLDVAGVLLWRAAGPPGPAAMADLRKALGR